MRCYLGYPLDEAICELEEKGFSVSLVEVRSKKGIDSDEKRVIRQKMTGESTVELCFSRVITEAASKNDEQI